MFSLQYVIIMVLLIITMFGGFILTVYYFALLSAITEDPDIIRRASQAIYDEIDSFVLIIMLKRFIRLME